MSLSADYIDFKYRHLFIQWLINIDLPVFRRLAHNMPQWLIPKPTKPVHIRLPNELILQIDPVNDRGVEYSLYYTGTYEMGTLDVINKFLPEGGTFIDVGANIALMSLHAALVKRNGGRIIAFEPNPETFKIAEHNISINGFEQQIDLIQKGVGSHNEQRELFDNWSVNRGAASFVQNEDEVEGSMIEITTLDDLVDGRMVDLLKIDVEGYELEVLKGAKHLLQRNHPPVLIVECTEETEHQDYTRADLFKFIQETQPRYKFYKLKGTKLRRSPLIKIDTVGDLPTHDNLICVPAAV